MKRNRKGWWVAQHLYEGHNEGVQYRNRYDLELHLAYVRNQRMAAQMVRRAGGDLIALNYAHYAGAAILTTVKIPGAITLPAPLAIKTFHTHMIEGQVFKKTVGRLSSSRGSAWSSVSSCEECKAGNKLLGATNKLTDTAIKAIQEATEMIKMGMGIELVDEWLVRELTNLGEFNRMTARLEVGNIVMEGR